MEGCTAIALIQAARGQEPWYALPPPMTIAVQWGSWGQGRARAATAAPSTYPRRLWDLLIPCRHIQQDVRTAQQRQCSTPLPTTREAAPARTTAGRATR